MADSDYALYAYCTTCLDFVLLHGGLTIHEAQTMALTVQAAGVQRVKIGTDGHPMHRQEHVQCEELRAMVKP